MYNVTLTYEQLVTLAELATRHARLTKNEDDHALSVLLRTELARATYLARQCLDCG